MRNILFAIIASIGILTSFGRPAHAQIIAPYGAWGMNPVAFEHMAHAQAYQFRIQQEMVIAHQMHRAPNFSSINYPMDLIAVGGYPVAPMPMGYAPAPMPVPSAPVAPYGGAYPPSPYANGGGDYAGGYAANAYPGNTQTQPPIAQNSAPDMNAVYPMGQ